MSPCAGNGRRGAPARHCFHHMQPRAFSARTRRANAHDSRVCRRPRRRWRAHGPPPTSTMPRTRVVSHLTGRSGELRLRCQAVAFRPRQLGAAQALPKRRVRAGRESENLDIAASGRSAGREPGQRDRGQQGRGRRLPGQPPSSAPSSPRTRRRPRRHPLPRPLRWLPSSRVNRSLPLHLAVPARGGPLACRAPQRRPARSVCPAVGGASMNRVAKR